MDDITLIDAIVASGVMFGLGMLIALSGRNRDPQQRIMGRLIALGGLVMALVAAGTWHASAWGQLAAAVLLVIGGCTLLRSTQLETPE